jgi:hypothetical protein
MKTFIVYNLDSGLPIAVGEAMKQTGPALKRQRKQGFAPKHHRVQVH